MANSNEKLTVSALMNVFKPILDLSGKLDAPLAYGLAILVAVLVTVILGVVIPNNLLWALVLIVLAALAAFVFLDWQTRHPSMKERSSIDHILTSSVLYVVVHEEGDQTSLIPEAEVTLALPEPMVKKTSSNGATNFIISNQYIGQEFALNARMVGYKKRDPLRVVLRRNAHEFIPLQLKQGPMSEEIAKPSRREEGLDGATELIYDSQDEEEPFISWTLYATDGRFPSHIMINSRPTDGAATFELKADSNMLVGVNKSLRVLRGRVEFEYRVVHSDAEGPNVFFYMIPMQETGPGRVGLIEVGTNVEDDRRNAFSSYRRKFVVPVKHFGDGQWHQGRLQFDFRREPEAFYSIFAPRINEGSVFPGAGHLLFTNVKVFSNEV